MTTSSSMCSFRESVQHSFDNACCVFAEKENMFQIATNTGINTTLLRNKLNPSQSHRLTVEDLILITKESNNYCIVDCLLLRLDMVSAKLDLQSSEETLVRRALENSMNAGDMSRLALENSGEVRLPRRKRNELLKRAHQSVSNLVLLMHDLENKTSGVAPFLSMATDFVMTNGAPGLV
ncbi:phage regulatory CII family protein [Psychromonas ossibalaenae]|uniref:phage regulatory CII family protein n=1 Tax=Psychromonas ossibalaenae TaxID=444922 RepID=UPI0004762198|nr:phage regulatory CII family protein [Psychromonas ossibalaenae]